MSYTVTLGTSSLEITLDPTGSNVVDLTPKVAIKKVISSAKNTVRVLYTLSDKDQYKDIDLTDVSNQVTWSTGNLAGTQAALASFNTWLAASGGGGAGDASAANQVLQRTSRIDTSSTANITTADIVSSSTSGQNGQSIITGVPTAGSVALFALGGIDSVRVQVSGTWVGTLVSEVSLDGGTTWYITGVHLTGTSLSAGSFTANFSGTTNIASTTHYRIRATALSSGTAVVKVVESINPANVYISNALQIVDGVSGSSNKLIIKNASIAPIATDTALVVAISPNSNTAQETGGNLATIATNTGATSTNTLISGVNSTIITLAANGVFTGTSEDITNYGFISIAVFSNVASATNGLSMQQSIDGTNWEFLDTYSIPANTGKVFSIARNAKFFRIVYTNGGTIQASFRLQTIYTKYGIAPSSVRPQDGRTNDNDMQEIIAYGALFNGTTWDRALKGQQTMANSQAMTFASDQSTLSTSSTSNGIVSAGETGNSTNTILTAGSIYTGVFEDVSNYAAVSVYLYSDVASATDGLQIDFSYTSGTSLIKSFTLPAATKKEFLFPVVGNFMRVKFTNGGTDQAVFHMQTIYHKIAPAGIVSRPTDSKSNEMTPIEVQNMNFIYDPISNVWNRMSNQDLFITGQSAQTATVNNIIPAASGANANDVLLYRSFAIQVVSTGTGGTFIFEGSNDNSNFQPIPVFNQALAIPSIIVTAITATSSQIIYTGATMFRYVRLRIVTTITGGSIQAFTTFTPTPFSIGQTVVAQGTAANLNVTALLASITTSIVPGTAATNLGKAEDAVSASTDTGVFVLGVRRDTLTSSASATGDYNEIAVDTYGSLITKDQLRHKRTYSTSFTVVPAATATDIFQLIGSASTSVQITKIRISGFQTTGGQALVLIQKRSTANSGGTSSAATFVTHISSDAGATAVGAIYTANPTPGTSIGNLRTEYVPLPAATGNAQAIEFNFSERGRPVVLTGVTQAIAINLNSVTLTGCTLAISIEFTEE